MKSNFISYFFILSTLIYSLVACRDTSSYIVLKNHIDNNCFCGFSDINYNLEEVERKIMFKLNSSSSIKNEFEVFFDYKNNEEFSSGRINIEGDKVFFTRNNSKESKLFFDFNSDIGYEWNVNYLGLISNYKLTLVDKDVKNDYYKIKLLRIGPISSHETVLKEISLTKEGIKSIKLNAPGIGSDIECVFFKKEI